MNISDVFFDEDAPGDPLDYVEGSPGGLFVPLTGLSCSQTEIRAGGLTLVRMHPRTWRLIEKSWLVDLYQESYAAAPRFYCVIPVDSAEEMLADTDGFLERALAPLRELLLAMRLVTVGYVVDPDHATPVLRIDGVNHRAVGHERYRLYGTVFGDDLVLGPKERRLGDRTVSYPERVIHSSGRALRLENELLPVVERYLAVYRTYAAGPKSRAIEVAITNLTQGHNPLLTVREQLFCLITALEAVFGAFRRRRKEPGLESRVAQAASIFRGEDGDIQPRLAHEVRAVRNAIAHGADYSRDLPYEDAAEWMRDALRIGLPPLLLLATPAGSCGMKAATDPADEAAPTPSLAFQRLLDRAASAEQVAQQALETLETLAERLRRFRQQ